MNINKKNWPTVNLGDISEIIMGQSPPSATYNILGHGLPFFQGKTEFTDKHPKILKWCSTPTKIAEENDILITVRAPVGSINIADQKCCIGRGLAAIRSQNYNDYIQYYLKYFEPQLSNLGTGTIFGGISAKTLMELKLPLPPLAEQQRIVKLFQSIEHCVALADEQEKNVKQLWLALVNQFVNENPKFGNLLENELLKTYYFKDIVKKINKKIDPINDGITRIVAGENLESEDFKIRTWGNVGEQYLGPAFHMHFDKGDILYGSRRTYLKKVALADFTGVCANTTYVIKADEEYLLQDLLKHIMLSDQFTQYSIGVSKGSTNPYINWKDLNEYEFILPEIKTQRIISNLFDEILGIREKIREQKSLLQQLKQKLLNDILG